MRRSILFLLLFLAACQSINPRQTASAPAAQTAAAGRSEEPVVSSSPVAETSSATQPPVSTPFPSPAPATATSIAAQGFTVRLHPDGGLYVGDLVSFEVYAPPGSQAESRPLKVEYPTAESVQTAEGRFGRRGIGGASATSFLWVWNTQGLEPGKHSVRFSLGADGPTWAENVTLLPADDLPERESRAAWEVVSTECCQVAYVTGTLADRNLEVVLDMVDQQAAHASERLGITLNDPVQIVLVPRVLGHGGFASNAISLSYLDRDYMGGDKAAILHHEIVHILDSRLGGELRPTMLVEGFAVYVTGGHYKIEALLPRAAALLPPEPGCVDWAAAEAPVEEVEACGLDRFIPLKKLADNFYYQHHEIGYLEAGALIEYMVAEWGWQAYSDFYRDIHPPQTGSAVAGPNAAAQSAAIEAALLKHFGLGLPGLEQRFRLALTDEIVTPEVAADLDLSLQFYDTVRRYQQALDPSAHFMTAWLLDAEEMRKRDIVADYLRHPTAAENLALETLLAESAGDLAKTDYTDAAALLEAANTTLDRYPRDGLQAFSASPQAADYLDLVELALDAGYEPLRISYEENTARMLVQTSEPGVISLALARQPDGWVILTASSLNLNLWSGIYPAPQ